MIAQSFMDIDRSTPLLGGLAPREFMHRHWQKKPLLIRAAKPPGTAIVTRAELFALAGDDAVESRLVVRDGDRWSLRHGPFVRRSLPALKAPHWTLLVQGADLHLDGAPRLLGDFRFVPDARLDDLVGRELTWEAAPGASVIALPHPSGASTWLNDHARVELWRRGLELLAARWKALSVTG